MDTRFIPNNHREIEGRHAILSPSQYHWLNYDADKMRTVFTNNLRKEQGTYMHDLASRLIKTRTYVDRSIPSAFNMFVNDCIDDGMLSEIPLKVSENAFGTADGIKYDAKRNTLWVYDLKTGTSKPSFKQLMIYCAYFCIEYHINPKKLTFVCRLYQNDGYEEISPDPKEISDIIKKTLELDAVIADLRTQGRPYLGG